MFSKVLDDTKGGKVLVRLTTKDGKEIAQAAIRVSSTEWKKQKAVLTATADAADAVLSVCPQMAGKYALDMVSLFPQNTFKGRKNGLRRFGTDFGGPSSPFCPFPRRMCGSRRWCGQYL